MPLLDLLFALPALLPLPAQAAGKSATPQQDTLVQAAGKGATPQRNPPAQSAHITVSAAATETPTTGVAAALGIGTGFGAGFGVQVAIPFALPRTLLQIGPYVGFGAFPRIEEASARFAPSFGVLGFWGVRHRIFVELDVGPVAIATWKLHGTVVATELLYGPSALVGYEFLARRGFFTRLGVGVGTTGSYEVPAVLAASIAVGWKL